MRKKVYHLLSQKEFINKIPFFGYAKKGDSMKILITGATSGIAYNVARELIRRGHSLYLGTHTKGQCESLKQKLEKEGLKAICLKLDVTEEKDILKVAKIDFDCFLSHAGVGESGSLLEIDMASLKRVYDVNVFGNFRLLQEIYHHMQEKNKKGKIFVTSSLASILPFPYLGCYTSSKAAISMLVFTIQRELKVLNPNITISLIEPGAYQTGFNQVMIDKKGKRLWGTKDEDNITRLQRNLFSLIEKKSLSSIVKKVVREIERENPKFKIRTPLLQVIMAKFFLIFIR